MAFTEDDLSRIEKAIAKGVRVVQFADRRVEYGSMPDLLRARSEIQRALATMEGSRPRIIRYAHGGKGV